MGCFWGERDNNSYVSNSITYNYRVGSTPKAKNYRYGEAFKEKTTRSEGISCNSYANCYIGCSCASGWTQGTAPSSGEYVWATDNRYTGVNSLSVGSGLNASGIIDAQSASSGISASGLSADSGSGISAKSSGSGNYSVSTTTVYLITCCCSAGMATVGCIIPIFSITFLKRRYYAVATTYRFVFQTRSATTTTCRGCRICKVILTFRRYTIFTSSCPITIPCSGGTICRVIVCIKV